MILDRTIPPPSYSLAPFPLIEPTPINFDLGTKGYLFQADGQELIRLEWIFDNQYGITEQNWHHLATAQLLLEGTIHYSSAQIAHMIDYYGAYLIPEYSYDTTSLTLYCLRKHFVQLIPIVMEVLQNAMFPDDEILTFVRNNSQKLQVSLQKNDFVSRRMLIKTLFGSTRYGNSPGLDDYQNLAKETIQEIYAAQFARNKCTLILAGDWAPPYLDALRKSMDEFWTRVVPIQKPVIPVFPNLPAQEMQVEYKEGALQSAIRLGMRCLNRKHPDFPIFQLVSTLFGGYFGSRLMSNIREDKGYTYGIQASILPMRYTGLWSIATEVGVNVTQATLQEVQHELDRLHQEYVSVDELELVKNYMTGSFIGSLENVFSHADRFKNVLLSGLDNQYYYRYHNTMYALEPKDIMDFAQQHFQYDRLSKIVVGQLK
jgi:zinc protease